MSAQTLKIIALYEMRTLLRSWFFRIFAALAIIGLGIFNVAAMIESSNSPWIFRALPAAVPYANLIILNLGQAIVAVFLSTEFLKQDQKNDTIEVIYARSMSNSLYIWGKSLGILLVFFILNLIVLALGIGFSFLSNDSSLNILSYLAYPLLISVPTLVFILGLAFLMMILIKNQAITFIVLLGYIALSIFYLNQKWYHIFDYIAYQVPMMHSTISGFGNFQETLMHRGIFFMLGIAFIFFTITRLPRLPQRQKTIKTPFVIGVLFLLAGGLLGYTYIHAKNDTQEFRLKLIELNNQHIYNPRVTITDYQLHVDHKGNEIEVECTINAKNKNPVSLDTLLFRLNPELKIKSLEVNNSASSFNRNVHLIHIPLTASLKPADSVQIKIKYQGTINEDMAYLDQVGDTYMDNFSEQMYRIRKRHAYITPDFVCLTNDVNWYPESGAGYNTKKGAWYLPDFARFSVTVRTKPELEVISQGSSYQPDTSTTKFVSDYPIPKISLVIGKYNCYSIMVDSVKYSIYAWKHNDYFKPYFDSIADTIPSIIQGLQNEYENMRGLSYGFKHFNLVEVPIHFSPDNHIYSLTSNAIQPETILYPEKGVLLSNSDFKRLKKQSEKDMKGNNIQITAKEMQQQMFSQLIRNNFMYGNKLNIYANYYSFVSQLHSDDFWLLNQILEVFIMNRNFNTGSTSPWSNDGLSQSERINLELKEKSLQQLLGTGLMKENDQANPIHLYNVIEQKGMQLFSMLRTHYGKEKFDQFIIGFVKSYSHNTYSFNDFNQAFQDEFGEEIKDLVDRWYTVRELPGYIVKDINNYKIVEDEYSRYQLKFNISNPTPVDGHVSVSIEFKNANRDNNRDWWNSSINVDYSKDIFVPAQTALEVGMVFPSEPAYMAVYTNISENLPNYLQFNIDNFDKTSNAKAFDTTRVIPMFDFTSDENEYIVDNEDAGFSTYHKSQKGYLKEWADQKREINNPYSRIRYWNPPRDWQKILRSGFYGGFVHSAMYTKGGKGEQEVMWEFPVEDAGTYEVYFHLDKFEMGWNRNPKKSDYTFIVSNHMEDEDIHLQWDELESGWNYLGNWYFTDDTARVTLVNKSQGPMIFADAIKWVKEK